MAIMAVMAAASAASTAMSVKAQNDQANAEADAARNAAAADYIQQTEQQSQIDQQAAIDKSERAKQALMERAALRVAQGESGLSGLSQDREQAATYMNEAYDASLIEANKANRIRQTQFEKDATYANAQGRVNVASSRFTSGAMAGLQIGMSGATGAMQGYSVGKSLSGGKSAGGGKP